MAVMAFRSHVTRALDPRLPGNVIISAITLLVAAAAGVLALAGDRTLWLPLLTAGATFFTWSLGREVDPDHQSTALIAAVPAAALYLIGFEVGILVTVAVMMSARLVVASTGRRPLPTDLAGMVALAGAASFTPLGWVAGFGLAVAIYLDDRMGEEHNGQAVIAAIGAAVAASVVATLTDALPAALPEVRPILTIALGALALIAVIRDPVAPISLVDSRRKTLLVPARLHAARALVGLVLFFGCLLDASSTTTLATMSFTLALALGADAVERVQRARRPRMQPPESG
jgi:hypothetical protein